MKNQNKKIEEFIIQKKKEGANKTSFITVNYGISGNIEYGSYLEYRYLIFLIKKYGKQKQSNGGSKSIL